MRQHRAYEAMEAVTVGCTSVINGHAVTRWAAERYEVDTWGRTVDDAHAACDKICETPKY